MIWIEGIFIVLFGLALLWPLRGGEHEQTVSKTSTKTRTVHTK